MALIKCPDCGREFSDLATVCPNCARPRVASTSQARSAEPTRHNYGVGFVTYVVTIVVGWFLLWLAEDVGLTRALGYTFVIAGLIGLVSIGFRVVYRLLQKV